MVVHQQTETIHYKINMTATKSRNNALECCIGITPPQTHNPKIRDSCFFYSELVGHSGIRWFWWIFFQRQPNLGSEERPVTINYVQQSTLFFS